MNPKYTNCKIWSSPVNAKPRAGSVRCFSQTHPAKGNRGTAMEKADGIIAQSDGSVVFRGSTNGTDGDIVSGHGKDDLLICKMDAHSRRIKA
jgi:hypothetical protein